MKLPLVSGKDTIKALSKIGYAIDRQRGSHIVLWKEGATPLIVPNHPQLDRGTLRAIIRAAGLTVPEFNELIR